jgi:hypothetical protein
MMTRKCMTKLMLKLIVLVILKVHANDPTPLSSDSTPLSSTLHTFQLDNEGMEYNYHPCLKHWTVIKCGKKQGSGLCIIAKIINCLFKDPNHPKDYPIELYDLKRRCISRCAFELKVFGIDRGSCAVKCYEEYKKK